LKIIESHKFKIRLRIITDYIKKDKVSASINFARNLKKTIRNLGNSPFKYKQSDYFDNENIRDMTSMGYTVIYKVYVEEQTIVIVDIFNKNKPLDTTKYSSE
jgi:plasmid stabilization system protein ParE